MESGALRFFFAIEGGSIDCVDALISVRADISRSCGPGIGAPWEYALSESSTTRERIPLRLLERGATISRISTYIQRALQVSAECNYLTVAQRLVSSGASIYLKLQDMSAFQIAVENDSNPVLRYFSNLDGTEREGKANGI